MKVTRKLDITVLNWIVANEVRRKNSLLCRWSLQRDLPSLIAITFVRFSPQPVLVQSSHSRKRRIPLSAKLLNNTWSHDNVEMIRWDLFWFFATSISLLEKAERNVLAHRDVSNEDSLFRKLIFLINIVVTEEIDDVWMKLSLRPRKIYDLWINPYLLLNLQCWKNSLGSRGAYKAKRADYIQTV